jgi:hypothetical protein
MKYYISLVAILLAPALVSSAIVTSVGTGRDWVTGKKGTIRIYVDKHNTLDAKTVEISLYKNRRFWLDPKVFDVARFSIDDLLTMANHGKYQDSRGFLSIECVLPNWTYSSGSVYVVARNLNEKGNLVHNEISSGDFNFTNDKHWLPFTRRIAEYCNVVPLFPDDIRRDYNGRDAIKATPSVKIENLLYSSK